MEPPAASGTPPADTPFSPDSLRLLAEARQESDRLRHEYIGLEHLVFAMTRRPHGAASAILATCGVDPDRVRASLAATIGSGDAVPAPAEDRPYTTRTHRVFSLASESARELGHPRVEPVHLLVGIMRERVGIGAHVLGAHGLTAEAVHDAARATPRSSP